MKLETSTELLERVRAKHSSSWYGLSKLIGAHENTIGSWKAGRTIVDRKFAPRIAELLDETPEYVLLCLEHERETDAGLRKVWRRLAELITSRAASILLGALALAGLGSPTPSAAYDGSAGQRCGAIDILSNLRRWFGVRFLDRQPAELCCGA
jgi:hypothetical protein